jgi:hypothetical protein
VPKFDEEYHKIIGDIYFKDDFLYLDPNRKNPPGLDYP